MLIKRISIILLLQLVSFGAESDSRSVQAEFTRCQTVLNRVKRDMARFEQIILSIDKQSGREFSEDHELVTLRNRMEYFRSRIDRAENHADKLRRDLSKISGPTCSSCLSSSVGLFCRNSETLSTELDDYCARASALAVRAHSGPLNSLPRDSVDSSAHVRRARIDSTMARSQPILDSCADEAVAKLMKQCRVNLLAADSLLVCEEVQKAHKMLDLAELLFKKVLEKCARE